MKRCIIRITSSLHARTLGNFNFSYFTHTVFQMHVFSYRGTDYRSQEEVGDDAMGCRSNFITRSDILGLYDIRSKGHAIHLRRIMYTGILTNYSFVRANILRSSIMFLIFRFPNFEEMFKRAIFYCRYNAGLQLR